MKVKAVIIDLEGVIVSTVDCHYNAWKKIFDEENIPFTREFSKRLRGLSRMESLEIGLSNSAKKYTVEEKFRLTDEKNELYKEELRKLSGKDILEGVKEGLDELKKLDIRIAVESSSKNAKLILENIGLLDFFDAVVDGTEIMERKPNPEIFLITARKLGVKISGCIVVEDTLKGLYGARKSGAISCGIGNDVTKDECDYYIKSLVDLKSIIYDIENDE